MKLHAALLAAAAALAGCRSYEKKPIDWSAEAAALEPRTVEIPSAAAAAEIAIVANPDLNALRLKLANSKRAAAETGWWEDPELDFDFMRILRPADHPNLFGGSLGFTIPLSGAPALEKRAAEFYSEADAHAVRAAELDAAADAAKSIVKLASLRERAAILAAFCSDPAVARALSVAESLNRAGEVSTADLSAARLRRHARNHELRTLESEALAEEANLRKLLGLAPSVRISVPARDLHAEHSSPPPEPSPLDLARHPRVLAAEARLLSGEASLESEILKQYPDLKIGPAYEREEGLDRLGFVAGLSLPLWNRNRKAIAEAEGSRDSARLEALNVWRAAVLDSAAARSALESLLKHPPPPATEKEQAEKLAKAGELPPLDYFAVRDEICSLELDEAAWRAEVCAAYEELNRHVPAKE